MKTFSKKVSDVIPVPRLMEYKFDIVSSQVGMVVLMTGYKGGEDFTGMVVHVDDPTCDYPVGDYDTIWKIDKFVESNKKITLEN
jgi:hypothetical protein